MKKISEHLGQIIAALAGVALIISTIVVFNAPIAGFFGGIVEKEAGVADKVLASLDGMKISLSQTAEPGLHTFKWVKKPWSGAGSFIGTNVWTDGTNTYYSYNDEQYVLNGDTWEAKTWNGLTSFLGTDVWTDGTNIYHSAGSNQYVLNKETDTWEAKTWNGQQDAVNGQFWTDGENIYSSYLTNHYVLNGDTWETKTWNGLTDFLGVQIWSDGTNTYYSYLAQQYVLNKETDTWEEKTWNGLTSFYGYEIWQVGSKIYYSSGSTQYLLNKETDTWETVTYEGLSNFTGANIWTDGTNIYYSNSNKQYVFEEQNELPDAPTPDAPTTPEKQIEKNDLLGTWIGDVDGEEFELLLEDLGGKLFNARTGRRIGEFHWELEGNEITLDVYYSREEAEYILEPEAHVADDASSIVMGMYTFVRQ